MKAWVIKRRHDGLYKSIKPCLWENEIYKARCYETEATALKALKLSAYVGDDYTTYYSIIPINISEGDIEEHDYPAYLREHKLRAKLENVVPNLEAENQSLKERWEKLKEYIRHEYREENKNRKFSATYYVSCDIMKNLTDILDKMRELEKESKDDN